MIASPSFSRPSSSATMTGLPARSASRTSGMVARLMRAPPVLWMDDGICDRFGAEAAASKRSIRSTWRARMSVSMFTRSPTTRSPRVVAVSVSGMSDTSNHDPSGSSPTALTVSETPSTAIEPLSTTSGACAGVEREADDAPGVARTDRRAPCAVPSMWPCTMWPPRRSPTWAARSRLTASALGGAVERRHRERLRHHVGGEATRRRSRRR